MRSQPRGHASLLPAALAGSLFVCLVAAAKAQVSLATVVDLAQNNSTAVRIAKADLAKSTAAVEQVRDAYIPNFVIGSNAGYSHGYPTGQPSVGNASMQSLVYSASQRQYARAAHAGQQAANLSLKDAREQVALDASSAYIELDTVNRELAAATQQEGFTQELVRIEQQRADAGVDSELDRLQSSLKAAQLHLQRVHLDARAATLAQQLAALTGLPIGSIQPDHASIPEVPAITADHAPLEVAGLAASAQIALSKQFQARGDDRAWRSPTIGFGAVYNYDSNELNNYAQFYQPGTFTPNNVSFGLQISFPFFDFSARARAKQSAADALRATVETEQAKRQNEIQIATLDGSIRELDAQAEVASLEQQIANLQLKTVLTELETGNGASPGPGQPAQLNPKYEQLARIDERQKYEDSQEAALNLTKARLGLLRALGHMDDWIHQIKTGLPQTGPVQAASAKSGPVSTTVVPTN